VPGGRVEHELFKLGVRLADAIVVQTDEQVGMCVNTFEKRPTRIFSISEPAEVAPADRGAFLWAARLVNSKQPLELLEIAAANPDLEFMMVGVPAADAPEGFADEVMRRGEALPNVAMLQPRPRAELMKLVENATAVVNTSLHEGMPNTFLEGWSRGIPAISLHHDPDGVIEREGLGLFAHDDPEQFAQAARRIRDDAELRAQLSQRCREYIAHTHSPEAVGAQWAKVLGFSRGT